MALELFNYLTWAKRLSEVRPTNIYLLKNYIYLNECFIEYLGEIGGREGEERLKIS